MLSIFKRRITIEQAAMALSEVTQDIRTNYVQKVFPNTGLLNTDKVHEELFFLSVYTIDGLIKNPPGKSWKVNWEALDRQYYSNCAALYGKDISIFMSKYLDRMHFYNDNISGHIASIALLQNREDRLVTISPLVGEFFAKLCGVSEDNQNKLIGAGAFLLINLSIERLFSRSKIRV